MADPSGHHQTLRFPRGRHHSITSRNPSARSSAIYDESLRPPFAGPPGQSYGHALRPMDSRFSLNEQFATSRREYEFGEEDNMSIFYDRATLASEFGDEGGAGVEVAVEDYDAPDDMETDEVSRMLQGDHYEMLCLPRDGPLAPELVRKAYYRLFLLFYPETYPESLRRPAQRQFERAQEAFETLIAPERRARYDIGLVEGSDSAVNIEQYDEAFREAVWRRMKLGAGPGSDLGVRFSVGDAREGGISLGSGRPALKALDFSLGNTLTVGLPALRRVIESGVKSALEFGILRGKQQHPLMQTLEFGTPTLAVSGSVYGVVEDISKIPITLLADRYQPLLPQQLPRRRLIQLVESRLSPWVSLNIRQEITRSAQESSPNQAHWIKTGVEVQTDLLPEPSLGTRVEHHVRLPNATHPSLFEVSIRTPTRIGCLLPRLAVGAQHQIRGSTAFINMNSGDWTFGQGETCRFFDGMSRTSLRPLFAEFPLQTAPRMEVGLSTESAGTPRLWPFSEASRSDGGLKRLDTESSCGSGGSWTVSASASPRALGARLRYSRDITLSSTTIHRPSRLEVELCPDTFHADRYFAIRNLWSVTRLSNLGVELGVSQHNLHLSLYWSRLGQRLSLPLLISPCPLISPKAVFWAAVVPFTGFAALQFISSQRPSKPSLDLSSPAVQAAIARRRTQADALTMLLAHPVEARQRRNSSSGGLVVLSAKFGLQDHHGGWAVEEVADVTVAVAALADDTAEGRIRIPSGIRKGRIPGFWDPAPGREKVLHVRYLWKGREGVVEVRGREELVLPP